MSVIIGALIFGILFAVIELATKRAGLHKEISRKIAHVVSGTMAAFLPIFLSFHEIAILSLLFVPVMLFSKKVNLFSSIHEVKRRTYGELFFPLAITSVALLFPHRIIYVYAVLVMALGDGFASIIGQRYGKRKYELWASPKSYVGSLTFFVITLVIGSICLVTTDVNILQAILTSVSVGAILTLLEAALSYGLDNLILSPAAGLLLYSGLHLLNIN